MQCVQGMQARTNWDAHVRGPSCAIMEPSLNSTMECTMLSGWNHHLDI